MTFIDNNEIEEIGGKLPEETFAVGIFCNCLIDGEVDVSCLTNLAFGNFEPRVAEWREIFSHWIIDQYTSIGQVQYFGLTEITAPVPSGAPQLPTDLKGDLRFARAGT